MVTLVCGLVAAIIFILEFLGVKIEGHNLLYLGLFFLALAVTFCGYWPWNRNHTVQ
jgi:nicotinamide riboside transporter PnuC